MRVYTAPRWWWKEKCDFPAVKNLSASATTTRFSYRPTRLDAFVFDRQAFYIDACDVDALPFLLLFTHSGKNECIHSLPPLIPSACVRLEDEDVMVLDAPSDGRPTTVELLLAGTPAHSSIIILQPKNNKINIHTYMYTHTQRVRKGISVWPFSSEEWDGHFCI